MPWTISCPTCHKPFKIQEELAGRKVKCPGCGTVLLVPAAAGSTVTARKDSPSGDSAEKRVKKKKKKAAKSDGPSKGLLYLVIGGGVALFLTVVTLAVVYIPWGSFSSKEIEVVDAYTAVNGLSYHNAGEMALQSKITALAIPGRKKIIVTRPHPEGGYLKVKLQIPYKDVEAYFPGSYAASRPILTPGAIRLEGDGQNYPPYFWDSANDASGGYQLDFAPRPDNPRPLETYLGPSEQFNWMHEGDLRKGEDGMIFTGKRGLVAKIRVGAERQDGKGGDNPLNSLTGHKIFQDQDGLVPGPGGYVHVSWNQDSGGWIVSDELEMPNEIGRYWNLTCFFQRPKSGSEWTLQVLNKPKKIKLP